MTGPTGIAPADSQLCLRGIAAGLLTAALAVAAHGTGGSAVPTGALAAQLAVITATVGALVAGLRAAGQPWVLLGLLGGGQLLAHLMFSAAGHTHPPSSAGPSSDLAMLATHTIAVVVGAVLITVGDRLTNVLSRVARTAVGVDHRPSAIATTPPVIPRRADQPLRALVLARSVALRGPPVRLAR